MGAGTAKQRQQKQNTREQRTAKEISNVVKTQLGLKDGVATNLFGKDKTMYGKEASELTNEEMVKRGLLSYNPKTGGYTNIVRNPEGKYQVVGSSKRIKYGATGGAMGSGDPTGAMTSVPISQKMLQRQNIIKGVTTAALSTITPVFGTVMRAEAGRNIIDARQPKEAYQDYTKGFKAKQAGKKFTSDRNVLGLLNLQHNKKTKKDTLGGGDIQ